MVRAVGVLTNPHDAGLPSLSEFEAETAARIAGDLASASVPLKVWGPLRELSVGGWLTSLSISPWDPKRVLVGGDMLGIGLSTNGGDSWQQTTGLKSWEIDKFTWHPSKSNEVWVGTMSGPYKSTDGGKTWVEKRAGMPAYQGSKFSAPTHRIFFDRQSETTLYAFFGSNRRWKAPADALNYGDVYKSTDGGESWTLLSTIFDETNIVSAAQSSDGATWVANLAGQGIKRSTDDCATWSATTGAPVSNIQQVVAHPTNPSVFFATFGPTTSQSLGGVYKSTDAGATWSKVNGGLPSSTSSDFRGLAISSDGQTLWTSNVGTESGSGSQATFKSADGGTTWAVMISTGTRDQSKFGYGAQPTGDYAFAIDPNNANRVMFGSSDELYRTTDGGVTFDSAGNKMSSEGGIGRGYSGLIGQRVVFSPVQKDLVFLNGFDSGNLQRTTDGLHWKRPNLPSQFGGGYDVSFAGAVSDHVYALLGQAGTFRAVGHSSDKGETFTWVSGAGAGLPTAGSSGGNGHNSIRAISTDGSVVLMTLNSKIYKSTDFGATWTVLLNGSPMALELLVDLTTLSADGSTTTVYMAGTGGVYKSTNGGQSFTAITNSPVGGGSMYMAQHPTVPSTIFVCVFEPSTSASTNQGLWQYDGTTWTRLFNNKQTRGVAIDPSNPLRMLVTTDQNPYNDVSTASGVRLSEDGGATWTQVNDGLRLTRVRCVAFDPFVPGRAVMGSDGAGFYEAFFVATSPLEQLGVALDDEIERAQAAEAGLVPKSIASAKGELLVATADDVVSVLAPGSVGQVLTPDPSTATGLSYRSLGKVVSKAEDYTVGFGETVLVDASGAARTITLPSPAQGFEITVEKSDTSTNPVTVSAPGGSSIAGASSFILRRRHQSVVLISDGSNFWPKTTLPVDDPSVLPLNGGEQPVSDYVATSSTLNVGPNALKLVYLLARRTEVISKMRLFTGNAGFTSPSLFRVGVYSIASDGSGTLIAASDTDLTGTAPNSGNVGTGTQSVERVFASPFTKVAGALYALGFICVTPNSTNAQLVGLAMGNSGMSITSGSRLVANYNTLSDLPGSFTTSNLALTSGIPLLKLLP